MRIAIEIKKDLDKTFFNGALEYGMPKCFVTLAGLCIELCDQIIYLQSQIDGHGSILDEIESTAARAANTASCLANGIQPD